MSNCIHCGGLTIGDSIVRDNCREEYPVDDNGQRIITTEHGMFNDIIDWLVEDLEKDEDY